MRQALELAARGRGSVEPNPMVGAVIVRAGQVVAQGYHKTFGGPHAEVEALRAAQAAGADIRGATMYVTLEPCCHTNKKTPPCTAALVPAGLERVVIAMEDPDANVRGRGIAQLRSAGIQVTVGVCEQAARELLAAYIKLRTQRRPWVIAKWAQTVDGYLAIPQQRWISNETSRAAVHRLRGLCDGVLVGIGTVLADDPLLTNRSGAGRQPARVVLDAQLRTPLASQLIKSVAQSAVIVATTQHAAARNQARVQALQQAGATVLALPGEQGMVSLPALLDELGTRQWTYLLVEGGQKVVESFLSQGLCDEAQVFISPRRLESPVDGLPRLDINQIRTSLGLKLRHEQNLDGDTLLRFLA